MSELDNSTPWSNVQKRAFLAWADGYIIEYKNKRNGDWKIIGDSVLFDKKSEYREKRMPTADGSLGRKFKVRGIFRFRWKSVLERWLEDEECRFYDEKKQEWHPVKTSQHIWDCTTVYEVLEENPTV